MSTLKDSVLRGLGVQSYSRIDRGKAGAGAAADDAGGAGDEGHHLLRARSTASWGRRCTCGSRRSSSSAASARCRWRTSCACLGLSRLQQLPPVRGRARARHGRRGGPTAERARVGRGGQESPRIPSSPPSSGLSGAASAPPSSRAPSSSSSTTSYSSSLRWCSASSCFYARQEPLPHLLRPLRRRLRHHLLRPHPRVPVLRTLCSGCSTTHGPSGICIKGALATAVYRKTMRLSAAGRDGATTGEVLNTCNSTRSGWAT